MDRRARISITLGLVAIGTTIAFQNCSKQNFATAPETLTSLGFGVVAQPPPAETVCGAFDAGGITAKNCDVAHAFTGNLFVQPRASLISRNHGGAVVKAGASASIAAISINDWLSRAANGSPFTIVAQSFDTIGNPFSSGFTTQTGEVLKIPDADGNDVNVAAWFSIRMDGLFHLAPGDAPNKAYQFAVIADDGAQLFVQSPNHPGLQKIVDDQTPESVVNPGGYIPGTQYPRMGCAATINDPSTIVPIVLAADDVVPMRLTYYQGPIGLSLRLMYREIPATGGNDDFCETDVNGNKNLKSTLVKASPKLDPNALAGHGWKVIDSRNLGSL